MSDNKLSGYACAVPYRSRSAVARSKTTMRAVSVLSTFLLLSATRVQLASARGSSRDTTLATYNAGLVVGTIGNIDARVTVLIDQVLDGTSRIMSCTNMHVPHRRSPIFLRKTTK